MSDGKSWEYFRVPICTQIALDVSVSSDGEMRAGMRDYINDVIYCIHEHDAETSAEGCWKAGYQNETELVRDITTQVKFYGPRFTEKAFTLHDLYVYGALMAILPDGSSTGYQTAVEVTHEQSGDTTPAELYKILYRGGLTVLEREFLSRAAELKHPVPLFGVDASDPILFGNATVAFELFPAISSNGFQWTVKQLDLKDTPIRIDIVKHHDEEFVNLLRDVGEGIDPYFSNATMETTGRILRNLNAVPITDGANKGWSTIAPTWAVKLSKRRYMSDGD